MIRYETFLCFDPKDDLAYARQRFVQRCGHEPAEVIVDDMLRLGPALALEPSQPTGAPGRREIQLTFLEENDGHDGGVGNGSDQSLAADGTTEIAQGGGAG